MWHFPNVPKDSNIKNPYLKLTIMDMWCGIIGCQTCILLGQLIEGEGVENWILIVVDVIFYENFNDNNVFQSCHAIDHLTFMIEGASQSYDVGM